MLTEKALFSEQNLKLLADMARRRIQGAHDGRVEKYKRMKWMKTHNMANLVIGGDEKRQRYMFVPPIFQTAFETWVSGVDGAFRQDPRVTVLARGNTPQENAEGVQQLVNWNVQQTNHVMSINRISRDAIQMGLGVGKQSWEIMNFSEPSVSVDPFGNTVSVINERFQGNNISRRVHPNNYIQDPNALGNHFFQDKAMWCGEITKNSILEMMAIRERDGSVKGNIDKVIKATKDRKRRSLETQFWFKETPVDADMDFELTTINYELYGRWNIKGNEDDSSNFYKILYNEGLNLVVQIVKVIDHPYTLYRPRLKNNMYPGTSPVEAVLAINQISTVMVNASIENMISNLRRYIAIMKDSGINKDDFLNNTNNGILEFSPRASGFSNIRELIQEFQGRDINVGAMQSMFALFNDWTQRATSQSDLLTFGVKPSVGGGLSNTGETATGVSIVDTNTKTSVAAVMNSLGQSQEEHWGKKIISFQQNMLDKQIIEITGKDAIELRKSTVIGNFQLDVVSGIITNKLSMLNTVTNMLPFISGLAASAEKAGQTVNIDFTELAKSAAELGDFPNRGKIFPEQPVPTIPLPGQEGIPGVPGQQPGQQQINQAVTAAGI